MLDKTQVTKIAVAGFGAAMASVYAIPEAHATIIPISFTPGSVPFVSGSGSSGARPVYLSTASGPILSMLQFNNSRWKAFGSYVGNTYVAFELPGDTLIPSTFGTAIYQPVSKSQSGTAYVGFQNRATGNVGWFQVDWGGPGGAVKYLKGAYADAEGESIIVGQMPASGNGVPEPSELGLFALGLLALGAAGVRMRREARKAAELN